MSEYGLCQRGGLSGVKVTTKELQKFAKAMGLKYLDCVIPLPGGAKFSVAECPNRDQKKEVHEGIDELVYWETETGSHGWCCAKCGEVTQWG